MASTDSTGERPAAVRPASMALLRVTTGFLLIWWGLARIDNPGLGEMLSKTFYEGLFSDGFLQQAFGAAQTLLGALVVLGLFRIVVLPIQLAINLFTAIAVWWAIIDPWRWYLPGEAPFQFGQLFYPSAIIAAASLVLLAFVRDDRWSLDAMIAPRNR